MNPLNSHLNFLFNIPAVKSFDATFFIVVISDFSIELFTFLNMHRNFRHNLLQNLFKSCRLLYSVAVRGLSLCIFRPHLLVGNIWRSTISQQYLSVSTGTRFSVSPGAVIASNSSKRLKQGKQLLLLPCVVLWRPIMDFQPLQESQDQLLSGLNYSLLLLTL